MKRLYGVLALVIATVVLATGCSGIPRSGPVKQGNVIDEQNEPDLNFLPPGPQKDSSQDQLLRDFIRSASSPLDDYKIAREFLAPGFASAWNPDAGVTVDDLGERDYTRVNDTTFRLSVSPEATVGSTGVYREVESASVALSFSFVKVDGQWRISAAPDGIVLDSTTFTQVFEPSSLMFFDASWTTFVPDVRWFPLRASTATLIVSQLLRGPDAWLAGSVRTAFPDGTKLMNNSVPITGTTASINLNREALKANDTSLRRMKAQLSASLAGIAEVGAESISIDGQTVDIETLTVSTPRVDGRLLAMTADGFGFVSGGGIERIPGLSSQLEDLGALAATVNAGHTQAAALAASGVYSVQAKAKEPLLLDDRRGVIAPSLDNGGYVWSVPGSSPGKLIAFGTNGKSHAVATSWPGASGIASLQVSRDGTRVAALVKTGGTWRLLVAGIVRDADGVPVSVGEPIDFAAGDGTGLAVTWVDEQTVATLTTGSGSGGDIMLNEIGGPSQKLAQLDKPRQIVGSNVSDQLRGLTQSGDVVVQRGSGWQVTVSNVGFVATQLGSPLG